MLPPSHNPLVTLLDLAAAIDLPLSSIDVEILIFIHHDALPADRTRLALGFPRVVRAWEIWQARGDGNLCADQLRAQLAAEGLLVPTQRGWTHYA